MTCWLFTDREAGMLSMLEKEEAAQDKFKARISDGFTIRSR